MHVSLLCRTCVYRFMLSMLIFSTRATGPSWLPTCGPQTIIYTHGYRRGWSWRGGAGQPSGDEEDGACPELQIITCCISHAGPAGWETAGTPSLFNQISHLLALFCLRWLNVVVGLVAGEGGSYSSGAAPPEQRAPPAVREERRQPAAYSAPPTRQQPPPAEEEEEANDYDSDEASEYTICLLFLTVRWLMCLIWPHTQFDMSDFSSFMSCKLHQMWWLFKINLHCTVLCIVPVWDCVSSLCWCNTFAFLCTGNNSHQCFAE